MPHFAVPLLVSRWQQTGVAVLHQPTAVAVDRANQARLPAVHRADIVTVAAVQAAAIASQNIECSSFVAVVVAVPELHSTAAKLLR